MKTTRIVLLCMLAWTYASSQILIPPDKDKLLLGEISGQNLLAEKHGFPSPQQVLSMKEKLGLSKPQIRKIDELLKNLPVSTTVKGQEIVEAEEDLDRVFGTDTINEKSLRAKLEEISKLRAELQFVHLQVYLKTKQILSENQWQRFKELQGGEAK